MWNDGTVVCVSAAGDWVLSIGGPLLGGTYPDDRVVKRGSVGTTTAVAAAAGAAPGLGTWNTLSLTVVGTEATASLNGKALFTKETVRNTDTGFAALGLNQWVHAEFDNFAVASAASAAALGEAKIAAASRGHAGKAVGVSKCVSVDGAATASQEFKMLANWQLLHVQSGLCVEASSAAVGATLALAQCVHEKTLQQFRNDYTNIRNHLDAITLGAYQAVKTTLTLAGNLDGTVTLKGKGGGSKTTWMRWSFFPNTGQLRNQYERAMRVVCVCLCVY